MSNKIRSVQIGLLFKTSIPVESPNPGMLFLLQMYYNHKNATYASIKTAIHKLQ